MLDLARSPDAGFSAPFSTTKHAPVTALTHHTSRDVNEAREEWGRGRGQMLWGQGPKENYEAEAR